MLKPVLSPRRIGCSVCCIDPTAGRKGRTAGRDASLWHGVSPTNGCCAMLDMRACRAGTGEVIKAWDRGVAGMRVGDRRRITAPPQARARTQLPCSCLTP